MGDPLPGLAIASPVLAAPVAGGYKTPQQLALDIAGR